MIGGPPGVVPTGPPPPIPPPARPPAKDPLQRYSREQKHVWETREDAVITVLEDRVAFLMDWLMAPGGRVPFTVKLNEEEQLERYLDFKERESLIEAMKADPDAGPEAVRAYLDRMMILAMREAERGS